MCGCVFDALGKDRAVRKVPIASRVVEVQVAVRDGGDLIGPDTHALQLSVKRPGHGVVMLVGLGIHFGQPGVEEEECVRVPDQVSTNRDRLAGERVAGAVRHGEVAEIQPGDVTIRDHAGWYQRLETEEAGVITELRTYIIKRGRMESWLRNWREAMERNMALGIRVEWAGFDTESMGTFIFLRSFRNLEERTRQEEAFYGSDWWREVGDGVMSDVVTWESRLLDTAAVRDSAGELVDVLEPEAEIGSLFSSAS